MLERLAHAVTRTPRATLAAWLVVIAALTVLGIGTDREVPQANVRLGATESARELALRRATFGPTATVPILLEGRASAIDRAGPGLVQRLRSDPANHVLSPFDGPGGALRPRRGSALVVVVRSLARGEEPADALAPVRHAAQPAAGMRVSITGPAAVAERLNEISVTSAARCQLIALPLLLLVLLLLFRSPIAALIPAVVGGATVGAGVGIVRAAYDVGIGFDVFAPTIAGLMGLALGVDYSLLIVTRFRALLAAEDLAPAAAARAAVRTTLTAGRTVAHAGVVLCAAMLCALVLAPGTSLMSAAFAVLATTTVACVSALIAVPAALTLIGHRINRWSLGPAPALGSFRIARIVLRHPHLAGLACLVPLVALSLVGLSLHSGAPTAMQLDRHEPTRAAIERLRTQFGAGWEAPLEITAVADEGTAMAPYTLRRVVALQHRLARLPDVSSTVGPADLVRAAGGAPRVAAALGAAPPDAVNAASVFVSVGRGATAATMFVIPTVRWGSPALARLRGRVMDEVRLVQSHGGVHAAVGGLAAESVEYSEIVSGRLPLLFVVLALTSVAIIALLMRTIIVPLVTVALNIVTVGATFGVLSLGFVGAHPPLGGPGEIDSMAMTMMLVIIFALSIDYQVFLLGRMREHVDGLAWRSRLGATDAIRAGLLTTGPVVAGAALIMCTVFGAFATAESVFLRQLGTGLTVAIAIDATLVRMVLLPAVLTILGRDAWKAPAWPRFGRAQAPDQAT